MPEISQACTCAPHGWQRNNNIILTRLGGPPEYILHPCHRAPQSARPEGTPEKNKHIGRHSRIYRILVSGEYCITVILYKSGGPRPLKILAKMKNTSQFLS